MIGDSDSVGVSGEVLEHLLGPAEGRLGMDNPIFVPYGLEPGLPDFGMLEVSKSSVKLELMVFEGALQLGKKLTAEQSAHDANRQKEPVPTAPPPFAVADTPHARDDAVQVRMHMEVLSPSVQER